MKWRKWNNILHRDIGYLCVGLTVVYVSGVYCWGYGGAGNLGDGAAGIFPRSSPVLVIGSR